MDAERKERATTALKAMLIPMARAELATAGRLDLGAAMEASSEPIGSDSKASKPTVRWTQEEYPHAS
jgi:hypothetical protein